MPLPLFTAKPQAVYVHCLYNLIFMLTTLLVLIWTRLSLVPTILFIHLCPLQTLVFLSFRRSALLISQNSQLMPLLQTHGSPKFSFCLSSLTFKMVPANWISMLSVSWWLPQSHPPLQCFPSAPNLWTQQHLPPVDEDPKLTTKK